MVALICRPHQVCADVILAVPVDVQHIGQVIRVRQESPGHEPMHLECLALQPHAAVALAVISSYLMPCSRTAIRVVCAQNRTVAGNKI